MTQENSRDLHDAIAPHIPFLRRYARALTGSQYSGDRYTAAMLEAILADSSMFDSDLHPRVALFRAFSSVWVDLKDTAADADSEVDHLEKMARERLQQIDPRARQAFLLHALEEFAITDIAAIMNISEEEAKMLYEAGRGQIEDQTRSRIMIIEDEPIIAMDIRSIVLDLGHEAVGIADTHDTALILARKTKPDLLLCDIQLADGSSGIDAAQDIIAEVSIPVIFITAFPERLLTGERPEPTFLITKPFKRPAVEAAISQALFFDSATAIRDFSDVETAT